MRINKIYRKIYKKILLSHKPSSEKWYELVEVKCPECDANLNISEDAVSGEIVSCPDCGTDFEVTLAGNGDPTLKPAEIEGEDWGE